MSVISIFKISINDLTYVKLINENISIIIFKFNWYVRNNPIFDLVSFNRDDFYKSFVQSDCLINVEKINEISSSMIFIY